jgi:hypothetical protein
VFFIVTFVASIPALLLYEPLLKHHNYILGAGTDTRIAFGALLEIITAIANIATAVVLYPILKRQSQSISLGYVASRTLESTVIVIGIVPAKRRSHALMRASYADLATYWGTYLHLTHHRQMQKVPITSHFSMPPVGLEPTTVGLKVRCSTS